MNFTDNSDAAGQVSKVAFDAGLIARYGGRGPRYTSYPTALQFSGDFTAADYRRHARRSNATSRPLSVYVHIPFCESLCYYCACNKVVTRNRDRIAGYLRHLHREIEMQSTLFDPARTVRQLHLGGGTPTYLADQELDALMTALRRDFTLDAGDAREFSIEVDPRSVSPTSIARLAAFGFNRLSLGVQDFDPAVQAAVNRRQTVANVAAIVEQSRVSGMKSVSFDLIYGLPRQSVASFDRSLDAVVSMRPDRLAIYNYAHLPGRFRSQRLIRDAELPAPATKLMILQHTVERLQAEGYCYIGMDHFALPDDELVAAQRGGTLQRNFQGYSTHGDADLVAFGASAIGHIGNAFAQNATSTKDYAERIESGRLAIVRGLEVDADDQLRGAVIQQLMCQERFDIRGFERERQIDFERYFADELTRLAVLERDGLVCVSPDAIRVTREGRLLLRSIATVFDRHAPGPASAARYSRAI